MQPEAKEHLEPLPFIIDVREDAAGVLWVIAQVPDARWRSVVKGGSNGDHKIISDEQLYYDSIIEAFDARTGKILASKRISHYVNHFAADGEIGVVIEGKDLVPQLHL